MSTIKLLHQFFLIFWLGSLFVMPYLIAKRFEGAKKVYWGLEFPFMVLALICGGILVGAHPEKMKIGWFHMKLTAVLILVGLDLWTGSRKMISRRAQYLLQTGVGACVVVIFAAIIAMALR